MFCSLLSIKFADRGSIRAKRDSPCRANGFINQVRSSKVISFRFSKLTSQMFITLICLTQTAGWFRSSRKKDTLTVITLFESLTKGDRRYR